jgi:hypothetical protein
MKTNLKEMVLALANGDDSAAEESLKAEMKLRLEAYMTSGNIQQFVGQDIKSLVDTDEFKKISDTDPAFAKKLETAWKGDAASYARTKGKNFESLFQMMVKKTSVEKMSQLIKFDSEFTKIFSNLQSLNLMSFPVEKAQFKDNSVWSHERLARESFDQSEYDELLAECMSIEAEDLED